MAGLSRVAGRSWRRAWRTVLPQIAISVAGAVVATLMLSKVIAEHPMQIVPMTAAEPPAPAPVAQLWPRQTDPTRLFSLSFDIAPPAAPDAVQVAAPAPAVVAEPKPQAVAAKAEPKAIPAKPRRSVVAVAHVLPPTRPASLTIAAAEAAPAEPAESPRLFSVKLPGSVARVGGTVVTTVASLGERLWDQLP